jgi:hypothetical protein
MITFSQLLAINSIHAFSADQDHPAYSILKKMNGFVLDQLSKEVSPSTKIKTVQTRLQILCSLLIQLSGCLVNKSKACLSNIETNINISKHFTYASIS